MSAAKFHICPTCGSRVNHGIGGTIKAMRTAKDWTLDELSTHAHLAKGYLSDLENGKRDIGLASLNKLAKAFGLKASDILKRHEANQKP